MSEGYEVPTELPGSTGLVFFVSVYSNNTRAKHQYIYYFRAVTDGASHTFVQSSFDTYMHRRLDSHNMCFLFVSPFVYLEMSLFPSIFCIISAFSFMESTSYVLSFRILAFFYLVNMGWIFDISLLCENSINL